MFIMYLGEDVQADAGAFEDDRCLFESRVGYERIREVLETEREVRDLPRRRAGSHLQGQDRIRQRGFRLHARYAASSRMSAFE